jgi:hypothetical protein
MGKSTKSSVQYSFFGDWRNNPLIPTSGSALRFRSVFHIFHAEPSLFAFCNSSELAGFILGGDVDVRFMLLASRFHSRLTFCCSRYQFVKAESSAQHHIPLGSSMWGAPGLALALTGNAGMCFQQRAADIAVCLTESCFVLARFPSRLCAQRHQRHRAIQSVRPLFPRWPDVPSWIRLQGPSSHIAPVQNNTSVAGRGATCFRAGCSRRRRRVGCQSVLLRGGDTELSVPSPDSGGLCSSRARHCVLECNQ